MRTAAELRGVPGIGKGSDTRANSQLEYDSTVNLDNLWAHMDSLPLPRSYLGLIVFFLRVASYFSFFNSLFVFSLSPLLSFLPPNFTSLFEQLKIWDCVLEKFYTFLFYL